MSEDFKEQVDGVARRMCEEMGLNPEDSVHWYAGEDVAPWESASSIITDSHMPRFGAPNNEAHHHFLPLGHGPRWRGFRRAAAVHLAGWYAVNKYMLIDA